MNRRSFIGAVSALLAGIKLKPTCPVPAVNPRIGLSGQMLAMRNGRPQFSEPFFSDLRSSLSEIQEHRRLTIYTDQKYRDEIHRITDKDLKLGLSVFTEKSNFQKLQNL